MRRNAGKPKEPPRYHAQSDYRWAIDLAARLNGDAQLVNLYMRWMEARIRHIVARHWYKIEALAKALLDRRELTGKEATAVIRDGAQAIANVRAQQVVKYRLIAQPATAAPDRR